MESRVFLEQVRVRVRVCARHHSADLNTLLLNKLRSFLSGFGGGY